MNDKFCSLPWVGLDISAQGNFKPCCKYINTIADNLLDYENSVELADLKNQFSAGEMPVGCSRCWRDEEAGIPSKRQLDFEYTLKNYRDLDKYRIVSIPFGNTCNLACRICSPGSSSKWGTEVRYISDQLPEVKFYPHKKFYKQQNFVDEIFEKTKDALLFEFPGGEPFLTGVKEHLAFLERLVEYGNTKNTKLHYVTNTTLLPSEKFWNLWKNFKNVDIQLSIDGTEDQFEYNRWPASWNNSYKNIKSIQEKCQSADNMQLSISHTVSIFTVLYLDSFLKWCDSEKLPSPYLGLLSKPIHYSCKELPHSVKYKIANLLTDQRTESIKNDLLLGPESNNESMKTFAHYTTVLDERRSQSFKNTFPELFNLLKEYFHA